MMLGDTFRGELCRAGSVAGPDGPGGSRLRRSVFAGCGGRLYGSSGSFASPGYPGTYRNHTDCQWDITVPRGRVPTVSFDFISIDDPGDCSSNYLVLYDGPEASSPAAGPFCGTVGAGCRRCVPAALPGGGADSPEPSGGAGGRLRPLRSLPRRLPAPPSGRQRAPSAVCAACRGAELPSRLCPSSCLT